MGKLCKTMYKLLKLVKASYNKTAEKLPFFWYTCLVLLIFSHSTAQEWTEGSEIFPDRDRERGMVSWYLQKSVYSSEIQSLSQTAEERSWASGRINWLAVIRWNYILVEVFWSKQKVYGWKKGILKPRCGRNITFGYNRRRAPIYEQHIIEMRAPPHPLQ